MYGASALDDMFQSQIWDNNISIAITSTPGTEHVIERHDIAAAWYVQEILGLCLEAADVLVLLPSTWTLQDSSAVFPCSTSFL